MTRDYPQRTPILIGGTLRRRRLLPTGGARVVEPGQQVDAWTPIAHAPAAALPELVDVAGVLGVSPDEAARLVAHQGKHPGDVLAPGEVIAERPGVLGIGRRICRAPRAGVLAHVSAVTGIAILSAAQPPADAATADPSSPTAARAAEPLPIEIRAHLSGTVVELSEDAVTIEGDALALRGVAGAGPATSGPLFVWDAGEGPGSGSAAGRPGAQAAAAGTQPPSGAIVACRRALSWADITRLATAGAAAIVAPAADDEVWTRLGVTAAAHDGHRRNAAPVGLRPQPPLTLVLTDELPAASRGAAAVCEALWSELAARAGHTVAVLGFEPGRLPEVLLPSAEMPDPQHLAPGSRLQIGAHVRITSGPQAGLTGRVSGCTDHPRSSPSELMAPAAEVELDDGTGCRAPLVNLELLR